MTDTYPNEAERAAGLAWLAMLHPDGPMPAAIALDMVQEATDDRDDAVCSLLMAAAVWLDGMRPESAVGAVSTSLNIAISLRGHMLCEGYGLAENCLRELMNLSREVRNEFAAENPMYDFEDDELAARWHRWGHSAKWAIDLCRQVTGAAGHSDRG